MPIDLPPIFRGIVPKTGPAPAGPSSPPVSGRILAESNIHFSQKFKQRNLFTLQNRAQKIGKITAGSLPGDLYRQFKSRYLGDLQHKLIHTGQAKRETSTAWPSLELALPGAGAPAGPNLLAGSSPLTQGNLGVPSLSVGQVIPRKENDPNYIPENMRPAARPAAKKPVVLPSQRIHSRIEEVHPKGDNSSAGEAPAANSPSAPTVQREIAPVEPASPRLVPQSLAAVQREVAPSTPERPFKAGQPTRPAQAEAPAPARPPIETYQVPVVRRPSQLPPSKAPARSEPPTVQRMPARPLNRPNQATGEPPINSPQRPPADLAPRSQEPGRQPEAENPRPAALVQPEPEPPTSTAPVASKTPATTHHDIPAPAPRRIEARPVSRPAARPPESAGTVQREAIASQVRREYPHAPVEPDPAQETDRSTGPAPVPTRPTPAELTPRPAATTPASLPATPLSNPRPHLLRQPHRPPARLSSPVRKIQEIKLARLPLRKFARPAQRPAPLAVQREMVLPRPAATPLPAATPPPAANAEQRSALELPFPSEANPARPLGPAPRLAIPVEPGGEQKRLGLPLKRFGRAVPLLTRPPLRRMSQPGRPALIQRQISPKSADRPTPERRPGIAAQPARPDSQPLSPLPGPQAPLSLPGRQPPVVQAVPLPRPGQAARPAQIAALIARPARTASAPALIQPRPERTLPQQIQRKYAAHAAAKAVQPLERTLAHPAAPPSTPANATVQREPATESPHPSAKPAAYAEMPLPLPHPAPAPADTGLVQRTAADPSSGGGAALEPATAGSPEPQAQPQPNPRQALDLDQIASQVYPILLRKLEIEKERSFNGSWRS